MTTEIQYIHFSPRCLSEYICLSAVSLCCSSELQGGNAENKYNLLSPGLIQAGSHNEPNHSEAKMEIFASELIRQGMAPPPK